MIEFKKEKHGVVLSYTGDYPGGRWVFQELQRSQKVVISKVFKFTSKELISNPYPDDDYSPIDFKVATCVDEYYFFSKNIISSECDLYIHKDVSLERKLFVAERGISIFRKIGNLTTDPIFLGGEKDGAIPLDVFYELLRKFPNTNELNRYSAARIEATLSSYIQFKENNEEKYQKYLNKKVSRQGADLQLSFSESELFKYQSILEKLKDMLNNEVSYTEAQWQEELLQIILLLHPKYIHVFKEAQVRDTYGNTNRNVDFLLIDSNGNTDIVEIKKPFGKCIVTERTYRDNHIPLRELSGTVMQIEKYIFYLNKWGKKGEDKLTEVYKEQLGEGFRVRITNPCGIIIMGRNKGLTLEQQQDFEVIKRKYKNVIDIITYDDLLDRLERTVTHWFKTHNKSIQQTANAVTD
ncbi:Shedu immune nuclease family protein [Shewanella algae]|uniref:Shedu immune nuclease family protein n=1 Tax=Shewanella algae TaxID=38313 RepID=UPI00313CA73E